MKLLLLPLCQQIGDLDTKESNTSHGLKSRKQRNHYLQRLRLQKHTHLMKPLPSSQLPHQRNKSQSTTKFMLNTHGQYVSTTTAPSMRVTNEDPAGIPRNKKDMINLFLNTLKGIHGLKTAISHKLNVGISELLIILYLFQTLLRIHLFLLQIHLYLLRICLFPDSFRKHQDEKPL